MKMTLMKEPFQAMKRGRKKVELRLNDEKRRTIKVDYKVQFFLMEDDFQVLQFRVTQIRNFTDFKSVYEIYPEEAIFNVAQYYEVQDIEKYGVLAIELGSV